MAKVSVIMSVFNSEKYLKEAIDSILQQTFTNFEFIIINDSSHDSSVQIIEEYDDERIRLIHNDFNLGLTKSLNKAITLAKGKYIARMDADDISLPDRFKYQVEFLDSNPDVGMCGTWFENFPKREIIKPETNSNLLIVKLLQRNEFGHPTVMLRKETLDIHNLRYNETYETSQDYELWSRLNTVSKACNIPQVLLKYRVHENQITEKKKQKVEHYTGLIKKNLLSQLTSFSQEEGDFHLLLMNDSYFCTNEIVKKGKKWYKFLLKKNIEKEVFPQNEFKWFIKNRTIRLHQKYIYSNYINAENHSIKLLYKFVKTDLYMLPHFKLLALIRFLQKCIIA